MIRLGHVLFRPGAIIALALTAAACATAPSPGPGSAPGPSSRPEPAPAGISPAALPGWDQEDHRAAFDAYLAGCGVAREATAVQVCAAARDLARTSRPVTPSQARAFFEARFSAVAATTADGRPGLLTAYFAPEHSARRRPDAEFSAPVLARPADLIRSGTAVTQRRSDGSTGPYPDRAAIEAAAERGAFPAQVLGWMRPEELFFLQIQGSGYLTFEDGGRTRAAYAADNGRPFVGIARPMAERGLLPANGTSGEAIRAWLAARRGPEAKAITDLNPRYIFFQAAPDDGGDPAGAAGVPLPGRRAIAVDPAAWRYGDLVWIDADGGNLPGARANYHGLVMALDTGSAIRGPVRADFYVGRGAAAGEEAGAVRHPLRMWRLVPR